MVDKKEQTERGTAVIERTATSRPHLYKVILLNDDYTSMDFVVQILKSVFHLSAGDAERIMLAVHNQGKGVAGIYSKEIAETKIMTVHLVAQQNEFPLRCMMEPE